MKKTLFILGLCVITFTSCNKGNDAKVSDAVENKTDTTKTTAKFKVSEGSLVQFEAFHALRTVPRNGDVTISAGTISVDEDKIVGGTFDLDLNTIRINVASVDNDSAKLPQLEGHLKSEDFFDITKFPMAKFEISEVTTGDKEGFNSKISGNLTLKDVTKNVTFDANVDVLENGITLTSDKFTLDRTLWNLNFNLEGAEGVVKDRAVSKDIDFVIEVTATK